MNAIDLIKAQHLRICELGEELIAAAPLRRGGLLRQLERVMEAHAEMEEHLFYPLFDTASSHEALVQYAEDHRLVRGLMITVDHRGVTSPTFERDIESLLDAFAAHAFDEEEAKLLPLIQRRLGIVQLHVLGSELLALYGELVTHPLEMHLELEARRTHL